MKKKGWGGEVQNGLQTTFESCYLLKKYRVTAGNGGRTSAQGGLLRGKGEMP